VENPDSALTIGQLFAAECLKIERMNALKGYLTFIVVALASTQVLAQKETESVEKYRVVYEYTAPQYEVIGDGGTTSTVRSNVPSDSMGVYYYFDTGLPHLLDLHKRGNEATSEGPGFRIQIYAGSKMETANEAKTDFLQTFRSANMEVYKDWNPPHFWVRVGDFLSRNEAMKQLSQVRTVFPDAFVVQDKIKLPKYKKQNHHD
jgi:hypothetical protein